MKKSSQIWVFLMACLFLYARQPLPILGADAANPPVTASSSTKTPFSLDSIGRWLSREVRSLESQRDQALQKLATLPPAPVEQESERRGYHSRFSSSANSPMWIALDLGAPEKIDSVILVPCNVAYGGHPGPGFGFPVRFKVEIANEADFGIATVLADYTTSDFPNPGDLPVFIPAQGRTARYLRVTATKLWLRGDAFLFALSEIMVLQGTRNIAIAATVSDNSAYENPPAWRTENATDGQSVLGPPVLVAKAPGNGYHSIEGAKDPDRIGWVQVDLGNPHPLDEVRLFPARPSDFPSRRGFGFPVRFRVEASNDPDFLGVVWTIADYSKEDFLNPAENPVSFRVRDITAQYVRVTATRWWHRNRDYVFALAEMAVYSGDKNVALNAPVQSDTFTSFSTWRNEFLVDGFNSQGKIVQWPEWLQALSQRREAMQHLAFLETRRARLISAVVLQAARWTTVAAVIAILAIVAIAYRLRLKRLREVDYLRTRIASDLHDEIGSNLGSIALLSRMMQSESSLSAENQQTVQEIHRTSMQTLESMREIVWLIHPGNDQLDELVDRLRDFSRNMLAGVECSFEAPSNNGHTRLSLETRRQVYLIFKEILHNVAKHSSASRVKISIAERNHQFELTVSDNGVGFDPQTNSPGHGLKSLRHRVEKLGGQLQIESEPGAGTQVQFKLQLAA